VFGGFALVGYLGGGPLVEGLLKVGSCLEASAGVSVELFLKLVERAPREEYGDFGFPLLRFVRADSVEGVVGSVASCLGGSVDYLSLDVVKGFLNIRFNEVKLGGVVIDLTANGWAPGIARVGDGEVKTIVVEHTSANPVHPLHMGHARNSSLGDTLARMLKARGHRVVRRFYVNDMGRQVAVLTLGFKILGLTPQYVASRLKAKIDHAVGWVYALTHTTIDLVLARKGAIEEDAESLASTIARLREKDVELADMIIENVMKLEDPEAELSRIMSRYEAGLEPERSIVRSVAGKVIEGFKETLEKLGVEFDYWDWESDVVWSGLLSSTLEKLKGSRYIVKHKDALALDVARVAKEVVEPSGELSQTIRLPRGFEIPPMILARSDGTTLYWTRDIAYSLYKFESSKADMVVNVIAGEQRLPQLQIRLALLALGRVREAVNMIHYDYEMVRLPGRVMRGRRGEYVSLDEIVEDAEARALQEVLKRNPGLGVEEARIIAGKVAVGAIRFSLVQPGALKPIVFDVEKVLNFEENTGPYLQYTYARAHNILEKHGPIDFSLADPRAYSDSLRRALLIQALTYPLVAAKAADELRPEDLASYLLKLADTFNRWYQRDSVIHEQDMGAREAKAILVKLVRDVLSSGLGVLGVPVLERM
jgi:arginyl-tRNA synthetase